MRVSLAAIKRRLKPEGLIRQPEIRDLLQRALAFEQSLRAVKDKNAPASFWYPWDSFGTLSLLNQLLRDRHRFLDALIDGEAVADLGCGDGDLAFFFESQGYRVIAVDNPPTNFNQMRGVRKLHSELRSHLRIEERDLDLSPPARLPRCGLALFFGILYHLKNPFGVLESLAHQARYCLLSTAVTRYVPNGAVDVAELPLALLAGRDGLRGDETNYWIFSEAGLHTLLDRSGWQVREWMVLPADASILWGSQQDERVFCLLQSKVRGSRSRTQLVSGWHILENDAWRWTERRFSIALEAGVRKLLLRCTLPKPLVLPLTVSAFERGRMLGTKTFHRRGDDASIAGR